LAQAAITDFTCTDDGDGGIVMGSPTLASIGTAEYRMDIGGKQYFSPAHAQGNFTTDTPTDPTVWLVQTVDNYTGFSWTGYHIAIGMDKPFSISHTSGFAPNGWTWAVTDPQPGLQLPNHGPGETGYVGYIDYSLGAGSPIDPLGSGMFGPVVSFLGSVQFCTEQVPVPEPTTAMLLGLGGLFLRRRTRK
jgi:hypothetical protein